MRDTIRRYWDSRAAAFDQGRSKGLHSQDQRAAWQETVAGWTGGTALDVLDVGCGTGFLALLIAELGHRAAGVDLAAEMVRQARAKAAGGSADPVEGDAAGLAPGGAEAERSPIVFAQGEAERLPFRDGAFDLVVERFTLWTLPSPAAALRDWARVLRPGGRLVLVEGEWRDTAHHSAYRDIRDGLPLYGGLPADELADLVGGFFRDVEVQPLDDAVLWGGAPPRERYAVHARTLDRPC